MQFSKYKRIGILTAAAVASLQAASMAFGAPGTETIYFTEAGSPPPAEPQLTNSAAPSGANQGVFTPTPTLAEPNVLQVVGGNSFYVPGYVNDINPTGHGDTSDYLQVAGFNPNTPNVTDNVFVALKLDAGGTPISPADTTDLDAIINSINTDNSATFGTNIAGLVPASFQGVFGGYDILLSFPNSFTSAVTPGTGSNGQFDIGFNVSNYSTDSGQVTVTDIGVVPEPGCLGILTAAGWVLFPRYRRYRRA